jgi:O-antigen/teichoic acid export membrane protein
LGRYEAVFVIFVGFLAFGWLVNILSNPAYAVNLGTGALRWVSIGCATTVLLNATLGYAAGKTLGGTAVVAASAFSLAVGYAVVLIAYHLENRVPFGDLLPNHSAGILAASAVAVVVFLPFFCRANLRRVTADPAVVAAFCLLLAMMTLTMWLHPMRRQLLNWISAHLPA